MEKIWTNVVPQSVEIVLRLHRQFSSSPFPLLQKPWYISALVLKFCVQVLYKGNCSTAPRVLGPIFCVQKTKQV